MGKKRNVSYAAARAKERKENAPAPRVKMNNKLKLVLGIVALAVAVVTMIGKLSMTIAVPVMLVLLAVSNFSDAYQYIKHGTTPADKRKGIIIGVTTVFLAALLLYILYGQG